MTDATTEWSADVSKIQDVVRELNEARNIPKSLRVDLENRLVLAWGEIPDPQDQSTTAWRKRNARNIYQEIQDESQHLFLAFVLAMGPPACSKSGFKKCVQALLKAEEDTPHKLQLNLKAKELFESIANKRGFADNARYVSLTRSLFPEGSQDPIFLPHYS